MIDKNTDWIIPYVSKTYGSEGLRTFFRQYEKQDSCKGRMDAQYMDCMYQKMSCSLEEVINSYNKH